MLFVITSFSLRWNDKEVISADSKIDLTSSTSRDKILF